MPYVLDTDIISNVQQSNTVVLAHLRAAPVAEVFVTVVSLEEQMAGRLSQINKANKVPRPGSLVSPYQGLLSALSFYALYLPDKVLPYDVDAALQDQDIRQQGLRMGAGDRRIAAITLANNCTLITHNTRHFAGIPGLPIIGWMVP